MKYRTVNSSGEMAGGPMYVLQRGLKWPWLGTIFALLTAVAAFGIGNMVQANSISVLLRDSLSVPQWVSGGVLMFLTGLVILGGIRSIARVCAVLVPSWPSPT